MELTELLWVRSLHCAQSGLCSSASAEPMSLCCCSEQLLLTIPEYGCRSSWSPPSSVCALRGTSLSLWFSVIQPLRNEQQQVIVRSITARQTLLQQ